MFQRNLQVDVLLVPTRMLEPAAVKTAVAGISVLQQTPIITEIALKELALNGFEMMQLEPGELR